MALKRKNKKDIAELVDETMTPAESQVEEAIAKFNDQAELDAAAIIEENKQKEFEIFVDSEIKKAKHLTDEGLTLIGQATTLKKNADVLLIEGKEVMVNAEIIHGNGINLSETVIVLESNLDGEEKELNVAESKVLELEAKLRDAVLDRDEKLDKRNNTRTELTLKVDERDFALNKANDLREKANDIIKEAHESSKESVRMKEQGKALVAEGTRISKEAEEKQNKHSDAEFTKEIKMEFTQGPVEVTADNIDRLGETELKAATVTVLKTLASDLGIEVKDMKKAELVSAILERK